MTKDRRQSLLDIPNSYNSSKKAPIDFHKELSYNFLVIWEHSIKDSSYIISLNQKLKEASYVTA